jgi:hypothetical protein
MLALLLVNLLWDDTLDNLVWVQTRVLPITYGPQTLVLNTVHPHGARGEKEHMTPYSNLCSFPVRMCSLTP